MDTCVDLFVVADFFILDTLCDHAWHVLVQHVLDRATDIQSSFRKQAREKEPQYQKLGTAENHQFLARFFDVAKRVYGIGIANFPPLRGALRVFVSSTKFIVLQEKIFGNRLFTDPELAGFAVDIFRWHVMLRSPIDQVQIPTLCKLCKVDLEGTTCVIGPNRGMGWEGHCRKCTRLGESYDGLKALGAVYPK